MKILHVVNTLSAGGAELHLLTLSRYLKQHGAEVVVACLKEKIKGSRSLREDFEKEDIGLVLLQADKRHDLRFPLKLAKFIKEMRPDILHSHLPRADIATAMTRRLTRSPVFLCSVHGIYRHRWFGTWAAPLMRWAYREANAIIAISAAVKDWLVQDFRISAEKINIIHYGIEPEQFTRLAARTSQPQDRPAQGVIGSLGRLEVGKGFDCLVQAMAVVRNHVPDVLLLVAGHDLYGYTQTLQALINRLKLGGHVQLAGFQTNVPSFLHSLDVFAFASRSEGFGQVLIEAMAAGKPVVASRIPPLTEIVVDQEIGLLVDPDKPQAFAEAIVWLLTHPEQAQRMGRQGQERVSQYFSAHRMAADILSLYDNLRKPPRYETARLAGNED
jgi:glycosyltransferase involved in cell wall biosynthesis